MDEINYNKWEEGEKEGHYLKEEGGGKKEGHKLKEDEREKKEG